MKTNKLGLMMATMVIAGWLQVGLGQSSTYQIVEGDFTWHEAKADAEARGGHLATITSKLENDYLMSISNSKRIWIGGTDENQEGAWEWVTGEEWSYSNWDKTNPANLEPNNGGNNEHYLMFANPVYWHDASVGDAIGYILEIPPPSTYEIIEGSFTWHEAKADAVTRGGHLATVTSQKEYDKIKELAGGGYYFLGGTDENQEGAWEWVTGQKWGYGQKWDYTNWHSGQPSNSNHREHYLHYNGGAGWNDVSGDSRMGYILEIPPPSTYVIIEGSFTWHEAKADAVARGGHLATVTSQKEYDKIRELAGTATYFLGGTDENLEGNWNWVTGEKWDYTNWLPEEPNNINGEHYLTQVYDNGVGWNDVGVEARLGYILEIPKVNLERGLVAYYPFNGNANDESGNGNDGEVHGATLAEDRNGESGKAYSFDGEDDFIQADHIDAYTASDYSISLWFNSKHSDEPKFLISKGRHNYEVHLVSPSSGNTGIRFLPRFGVGHWDSPDGSYSFDTWHQLIAIFNPSGDKIHLFIDGKIQELKGEIKFSVGNPNDSPIRIGRRMDEQGSYQFHGSIDDVRIYNRALSEAEVAALYELESTPSAYQIIEGDFTWHEAKADAEARGGHLATITSELEQQKINDLTKETNKQNKHFWLGGTDQENEGNWKWITDEPWSFNNWDSGGGNDGRGENVLSHHGNLNGKWNDLGATHAFVDGYILEIPKVDLDRGLVAYYPFNGNANDESGNGNDGEVNGATLAGDRFGNESSSYIFDGDKDVISSNLNQDLEDKTLSAWVKLSDLDQGGGGVVGVQIPQNNSSFDSVVYNERAAGWQFGSDNNQRSSDANQTETSSDWIFICATYKNNSYIFYRNGKQLFANQSYKVFKFNKPQLMIGQRHMAPAGNHPLENRLYLKGHIDDVRIYNRALSAEEVAALYEFERTPSVGPVDPGEPQLATGSATVVNGFMVDLTVDFGGKGYTNPPEVRIVGGGGSGATAKAVVTDGIVIDLIVLTPGIGYSSTPSVEIDMPPFPPKQASAKVQVVNGFVVGFEVTDSGRGYIEPPQISILSNTGSGAQAEAILSEGKLAEIKVLNPGIGYSDDATVEVGLPAYPPVRAAGQAEVINGFLVGLEVTDGGRGYGFAPRVKITGGGGSGATAVALVEDGKVVGLNITAAGSGYSSAPEIIIAPPKPEVMIVRGEEGVKVKASSNPGLRCRLEGSRDLITWSKVGNDVTSKSYEVDFKLDATETMHFFRVIWLD